MRELGITGCYNKRRLIEPKDQTRLPVTCAYERVVARKTRINWRTAFLGALYDGDDNDYDDGGGGGGDG